MIGRNAESTTAASGSGPAQTSRRPAAHSSHSAASGAPCGVSRDVHARIAVSRKPTMIAAENPNTISWTCQASPLIAGDRPATAWPRSDASQSAIETIPK
ncbi:hypothetical protein Y045_5746 [Burkholderia pseudomallei MSHR2451]|nr:hypothetical protein Y045_5746 [Burkholderia pseudomallei MSHR2451]